MIALLTPLVFPYGGTAIGGTNYRESQISSERNQGLAVARPSEQRALACANLVAKMLPHLSSLEFGNQSIIQYLACNMSKPRQLLANVDRGDALSAAAFNADDREVDRGAVGRNREMRQQMDN